MPQLSDENKAEIVRRRLAGENVKLLALEAGVKPDTVYCWVSRMGYGGYVRHRVRIDTLMVVSDWCRKLEAAGWPVRGRSLRQPLVLIRQALMLALHRNGHSCSNIAAGLGFRNYRTILHGARVARSYQHTRRLAEMITTATADELRAEIATWGGAS